MNSHVVLIMRSSMFNRSRIVRSRRILNSLKICQRLPRSEKCEILNLELGKVMRNGYKAAGHKLRGKIRIVSNFHTERLQLNHILVPHG